MHTCDDYRYCNAANNKNDEREGAILWIIIAIVIATLYLAYLI